MKLSTQTILALLIGIICGLMWGDIWHQFSWIGQVYIKLLQMSVLPYIVVALVAGIGQTDRDSALKLVKKPMAVYGAIWLATSCIIAVMYYCFPAWEFTTHFGATNTQVGSDYSLIDVFIPSNPFNSLANSMVPAVVFFSICVGIALIGSPGRDSVIIPFERMKDALSSISRFVAKLTPIGVFFITADAAGTMTFEQMNRIQIFILAFIAGGILLTLVILPIMCSMFSGVRTFRIIQAMSGCVITAFAIDNLFVVLPLIIEAAETLHEEAQTDSSWDSSLITVIASIAFVFPNAGKILRLLFIPFAAWDSGIPFSGSDLAVLASNGTLSMFGSPHVAIPFLLDFFHIPVDQYRLYLMARLITSRFGEAIGAMSIFCVVVGGTFAVKKPLKEMIPLNFKGLVAGGLSFALIVFSTSYLFDNILQKPDLSSSSILNKATITVEALPAPETAEKSRNPKMLPEGLKKE